MFAHLLNVDVFQLLLRQVEVVTVFAVEADGVSTLTIAEGLLAHTLSRVHGGQSFGFLKDLEEFKMLLVLRYQSELLLLLR